MSDAWNIVPPASDSLKWHPEWPEDEEGAAKKDFTVQTPEEGKYAVRGTNVLSTSVQNRGHARQPTSVAWHESWWTRTAGETGEHPPDRCRGKTPSAINKNEDEVSICLTESSASYFEEVDIICTWRTLATLRPTEAG